MDALNSAAMWLLSGSVLACVALLLLVVLALAVPVVVAALSATYLEKARTQPLHSHLDRDDADATPSGLRAQPRASGPGRLRDGAAA